MTQTIKDNVRDLLVRMPHLRDDDNRLIANYWLIESGGTAHNKQRTAYDFLKVFGTGNLTSAESIRRMRQKLQEEDITLRGAKYKLRHDLAEEIRLSI